MAHICEVCGKGIMSGNNVMSAPVACVPAKLPAHNQK